MQSKPSTCPHLVGVTRARDDPGHLAGSSSHLTSHFTSHISLPDLVIWVIMIKQSVSRHQNNKSTADCTSHCAGLGSRRCQACLSYRQLQIVVDSTQSWKALQLFSGADQVRLMGYYLHLTMEAQRPVDHSEFLNKKIEYLSS